MNVPVPARAAALILAAATAGPATAQTKNPAAPEPLAMGVTYVYQVGNPYWYQPVYYPAAYVSPNPYSLYSYPTYTYSSPYPFGATAPVFGLYSWDYGVYYPAAVRWYSPAAVTYPVPSGYSAYYPYSYPYSYYYPTYYPYFVASTLMPGRFWLGFGWW